jgi:hypothetical protein
MKRPPCPKCQSEKIVPIVYGLPRYEFFEKAKADEFILGGCTIYEDSPQWHCKECGHLWQTEPFKFE